VLGVQAWDILGDTPCPGDVPLDVVLDKGTYDAIGLSKNGAEDRQTYINKVHSILRPSGLVVITSCNYTEPELVSQFGESNSILCCARFDLKFLNFFRVPKNVADSSTNFQIWWQRREPSDSFGFQGFVGVVSQFLLL